MQHFRIDVDRIGVATVLIDQSGSSVNTLHPELVGEIEDVLDRIEAEPEIRAVVLASGKAKGFMAGGDIDWLRQIDDVATIRRAAAVGHRLFARLEAVAGDLGKPVIAAVEGACLGGGLELAMACSARVVADDPNTQLGQPEIRLGLIPGAGGTQRLPRLVGIAEALNMILTGRNISPRRALALGLANRLAPREDLIESARTLAIRSIGAPAKPSRRRVVGRLRTLATRREIQRLVFETTRPGKSMLFRQAYKRMIADTKGLYPAAPAAIRAVRAGIEHGTAAGYETELEEFAALAVGPEAKALMSLFAATQELKNDPGIDGEARPSQVNEVAVVGGGLMGSGIATVTVTKAGTRTFVKEIDEAAAERAAAHVTRFIDDRLERGRLDIARAEAAKQLVVPATDWAGFSNTDLVIEAVFEDLDLKRRMVSEAEAATPERSIFASNTSSIPISAIAEVASRPGHVIGMHYFSPVERMPLLEVVRAPKTDPAVVATCVEFGKRQGKTVIVVADGPGFYTSRIVAPYMSEASYLLAEGVPLGDIDDAMTEWGFPVGPLQLADEVGIDVATKVGKIVADGVSSRLSPHPSFAGLVADGRTGRKSGRGFYRYAKGKRRRADDSVYDVLGVTARRPIPFDEIQRRLGLRMVDEALRCLEEGIIRSARDGDVGAVFGLGFPPFRGGPFTYVDRIGAEAVLESLRALEGRHGDRFQPSELLIATAETGTRFR